MSIKPILASLVMCCAATSSSAQASNSSVDCKAPAHKDSVRCICADARNTNIDECLALPAPSREATNFIGLVGPILGGTGVLGALAAGAGSAPATTTTATTSTN